MKNIGLYFGSFNPIHIGHLVVGEYLVENADLDEVWLVVSPHNPFKKRSTLLDDYTRLHLVERALEDYPKLRASSVEFGLPQPSYTIDTLTHLKEASPTLEFSLIMGEDNLKTLPRWKNGDQILEHHRIFVYPRFETPKATPEPESNLGNALEIVHVAAPRMEISSSEIRRGIASGRSVKSMLPQIVWEYIDQNNLYK